MSPFPGVLEDVARILAIHSGPQGVRQQTGEITQPDGARSTNLGSGVWLSIRLLNVIMMIGAFGPRVRIVLYGFDWYRGRASERRPGRQIETNTA
jgi:hypothetical protein